MQKESAPEAHKRTSARAPSGLRRLSLAMIGTGKLAEEFKGTPGGQGATRPGQILAAFKAAAPHLGFNPRVVHVIDWLFTFTQPQDWLEGSRPVVWPSAAMQQEALSLGVTQAKAINRHLVELGLIVMKDSPNGKRYGHRDRQGRVIEAYGFDLSPLFLRMAEFQAVAAQGRELREEMRRLRRRATIARNGLLQILETVAEQGFDDAFWQALEREGRALARSLRSVERVEEMAIGVASLERWQMEARKKLENQMAAVADYTLKRVDSDPKGSENRPHIQSYNLTINPEQEQVIAPGASKWSGAVVDPKPSRMVERKEPLKAQKAPPEHNNRDTVLRITTDELVQLAPRLQPYLRTSSPTWSDMVEAADWLRHDLGVSKPLWGNACLAMGREQAAIALAIVSAKPETHFTASPGSYFHGMVKRAEAGTLNLVRTVWGLRKNPRRQGGFLRRQSQEKGEFLNS